MKIQLSWVPKKWLKKWAVNLEFTTYSYATTSDLILLCVHKSLSKERKKIQVYLFQFQDRFLFNKEARFFILESLIPAKSKTLLNLLRSSIVGVEWALTIALWRKRAIGALNWFASRGQRGNPGVESRAIHFSN